MSIVDWLVLILVLLLVTVTAYAGPVDPRCNVPTAGKRSTSTIHAFDRATGHPGGWPGHVRDHICPLACGGTDTVANLQWQSVAEGRAKDRIERTPLGYELYCNNPVAQ